MKGKKVAAKKELLATNGKLSDLKAKGKTADLNQVNQLATKVGEYIGMKWGLAFHVLEFTM